MANIINATDSSFDTDVINSDVPVLVDFWAPWCGPCKAIAPLLEDLATAYDGTASIVKVDVDDNKDVAATFGIRSIPTLFVFKGGEKVETLIGLQTKEQLTAAIDKHL